jgi:hypothetical protein
VCIGLHQQHLLVHLGPQHLGELQGRLLVLLLLLLQARHVLHVHATIDGHAMLLLLVVLLLVKEGRQQLWRKSPTNKGLGEWQQTAEGGMHTVGFNSSLSHGPRMTLRSMYHQQLGNVYSAWWEVWASAGGVKVQCSKFALAMLPWHCNGTALNC